MKKFLTLYIALTLLSCGGGGDEPTPPPAENKAPSTPTLTNPTNGLLCISNTVEFTWTSAVDPEGDLINYEIIVAKNPEFTQIISQKTVATLATSISLEKGTAYYWKIRAIDAKSKASEFTAVWNFLTEGVGVINYVPFVASLIKPNLNSTITGTSVVLEWNASDVDVNDVLTYDIFFGTTTTPPSIVTSHTSKTYTHTGILPNTTYYWRIDVKDGKGGKSTGQLWSFKTS